MMCSGPQLTGLHVSMTDAPSLSVLHKRLIGILLLILVLAGIWYLLQLTLPFAAAFHRGAWKQANPVDVVPAAGGSLDVQIKAIGTVTPLHSVVVRSRVDGELLRVHCNEGSAVEQGALLAEIDPAPYRARLAQAEGQAQQIQRSEERRVGKESRRRRR